MIDDASQVSNPKSIRQLLAEYKRALTTEELASILAVDPRTIQRRAKSGSIPSFRVGTSVRFCPKTMADWLTQVSIPSIGGGLNMRRLPKV